MKTSLFTNSTIYYDFLEHLHFSGSDIQRLWQLATFDADSKTANTSYPILLTRYFRHRNMVSLELPLCTSTRYYCSARASGLLNAPYWRFWAEEKDNYKELTYLESSSMVRFESKRIQFMLFYKCHEQNLS